MWLVHSNQAAKVFGHHIRFGYLTHAEKNGSEVALFPERANPHVQIQNKGVQSATA